MRGREFVAGEHVSVGDFVLAYTLDWGHQEQLLGEFPALLAYMQRMYDRPKAPMRIAAAAATVGTLKDTAPLDLERQRALATLTVGPRAHHPPRSERHHGATLGWSAVADKSLVRVFSLSVGDAASSVRRAGCATMNVFGSIPRTFHARATSTAGCSPRV